MSTRNILIICWDFPPNNGIGGRRWAKIAKQLVKFGYQVEVVCKEFNSSDTVSPWVNDVKQLSNRIHYLRPSLLSQWVSSNSSFKVKLSSVLLRWLCSGTIYDKALGVRSTFLKIVGSLIEERKIDTVFVTGAPFNLLYYTAQLKERIPEIRVVSDYRDPWITAENYGMKGLDSSRMNNEKMKQNLVIENSTIVTCPNEFLLKEIKETYTGNKATYASFKVLPHFYDKDDRVEHIVSTSDDVIRFVYAGTIYIGCDAYLEQLNDMITHYKASPNAKKFHFDFYVNEINKAFIFEQNRDVVSFHKPIGNKVFKEISNSNYVVILLSDHNKNYLTSKFFDYLPYQKPYFYVGPEGYVSKTIFEEELGVVARHKEDLVRIMSEETVLIDTRKTEKHELANVVMEFIRNLD